MDKLTKEQNKVLEENIKSLNRCIDNISKTDKVLIRVVKNLIKRMEVLKSKIK